MRELPDASTKTYLDGSIAGIGNTKVNTLAASVDDNAFIFGNDRTR